MARKQKRKGPGRPPRRPLSGEELRREAINNIRKSAERRAEEEQALLPPPPDTAEVLEEATAVTRKHRYSKEEMEELREKIDFIYQKYLQEQWEQEEQANKELNKRLHQEALSSEEGPGAVKLMSPEEWNLNHGLRYDGSKRRGPAPKRKKFVWELEPGDKGTATEPAEPIDVEAMEAELELRLMEDHIEQQRNQPQFLKGKRVRGSNRERQRRPQTKSFWI